MKQNIPFLFILLAFLISCKDEPKQDNFTEIGSEHFEKPEIIPDSPKPAIEIPGLATVFLSLPDSVLPPELSDSTTRKRLLNERNYSNGPMIFSLDKFDPKNGFMLIDATNMEDQGTGMYLEIVYWRQSDSSILAGVNEYYSSPLDDYSGRISFLEYVQPQNRSKWNGLEYIWYNRKVLPIPYNQMRKDQFLVRLPQEGMAIEVRDEKEQKPLLFSWKEGVFGLQDDVIDLYHTVPSKFLRNSLEYTLIAPEKDNRLNRSRIIERNNSLEGELWVSSHVDVDIWEGEMQLVKLDDEEYGTLLLIIANESFGTQYGMVLQVSDGEWMDITGEYYGEELQEIFSGKNPGGLIYYYDVRKQLLLSRPAIEDY